MADISKIKLPDGTTYNVKDNSKLVKTTYEYNTEIAFGSTGKLLIGKFQCYDSNVTITIQSTTNITYYAVAVLATQNIDTAGGGTFTWNTYGDTDNTVTPNLYAKYASGSDWIEIYFSPNNWSKNLIHIQANALRSDPTNICENVSEIPSSATRKPTNTFGTSPKFTDTTYALSTSGNNIVLTPSSGSANTITVPYATSAGSATDSTKLPIAGGTMTGALIPNGGINFTSTGLPQFAGSPPFYLGIEAFNDGGQVKWQQASNCSVGYATSAGSAAPTSGSAYYIQNNVGSSRATTTSGSWISMVNSSQTGSPTLPTASKWWTVLSADCWSSAPYNWMSQLAIATQEGAGVWWRRNDTSGTSIDSSTWHRLAEGDSDGNAKVANKLGTSTVGGTTTPIYLNAGTPTALSYTIAKSVPSDAVFTDTKVIQTALTNVSDNGEYYILMSPKNSSSTETNTSTKFKGLYFYNEGLIVGDGEYDDETRIGTTSIQTKYLNCDVRIYTPSVICTDITCNNISVADISCSSMSVTDISSQYTFTRTSGPWTCQGIRAVRCGNVVTMQVIIKGGTSVSEGSNGIQGTISGGPLPAKVNDGTQDMGVQGVNFYGVSALVGQLNSSGTFTLRLLIYSQSMGSNSTSVTFTFVCD